MLSISSVLGIGHEKTTQLLIATHVKHKKSEAPDLTQLWNTILEDFEVLVQKDEASRWPWRFLVLFAVGDEEVRVVEWGLTSYNAAEECCSECKADRQHHPWTDMRRGAAWRGTEFVTLDQYRARFRQPLHPLANSKLTWRYFFFLDCMHIMDCKGMASTIDGSVVFSLIRDERLGSNQQQRLDCINNKLRNFYDRNRHLHKLPKITLNSITGSSGWAELAGPAIKAAGTRAAAPFFAELCREFFNSDSTTGTCADLHLGWKSSTI